MADRPLRIGILGAAKIAPPALIAPAKATGVAEVVAVGARDPVRARAFADEHGIADVAGSYEALIAHPQVDAVYNALPPSRHADLSIAALKAGKPVLCEKPFCMNAAEAQAMVDAAAASGVLLMEAFHYRYHPLFLRVLEIVRSGRLGRLKTVDAVFNAPIPFREGELRHDPALGGGALMDLGTYCLHWVRSVAGEGTVTRARQVLSGTGVDLETEADIAFVDGATGHVACSMQPQGFAAKLEVEGEAGSLVALNPLAPQMGHRLTITVDGASEEESFSREPTYAFQLKAFVEAVRSGVAPPTSGADSVNQMALIDAIKAAARAAA